MKRKTIAILVILSTIVGIWIVKANTTLFKNKRIINNNTNNIKKNLIVNKKVSSSKYKDGEDEDGEVNYISINNVLLFGSANGTVSGVIKISDMNPVSVKSTFGNPNTETTEFSEVDNENILVYKYNACTISFLKDEVLNIDITDEGFSFILVKKDGNQLSLTTGSEATSLYNSFNTSWSSAVTANKQLHIFIKNSAGETTDTSLTFTLVNDLNDINNTIQMISFGQ